MDDLGDTLLMEILHRIPCTKTLIRSKCVCTRWCDLLSTPYFMWRRFSINSDDHRPFFFFFMDSLGGPLSKPAPSGRVLRTLDHLSYRKEKKDLRSGRRSLVPSPCVKLSWWSNNSILAATILASPREDFTDYMLAYCQNLHVLASCKDLILCGSLDKSRSLPYLVCNQFTMQCRIVPAPSINQDCVLQSFGLSCCSSRDDGLKKMEWRYRVVRLLLYIDGGAGSLCADVFSFETESWKNVKIVAPLPPYSSLYKYNPGIAYNGLLYWLETNWQEAIAAIDPYSMEPGRLIPIPRQANFNSHLRLGVCQGFLRLLQVPMNFMSADDMIVWELRDYESGQWNKVHETTLEEIHFGGTTYDIYPLGIHPSDGDTVFLWLQDYFMLPTTRIVSCNLQTKEVEVFECSKFSFPRGPDGEAFSFPVELPWWPTPIPST